MEARGQSRGGRGHRARWQSRADERGRRLSLRHGGWVRGLRAVSPTTPRRLLSLSALPPELPANAQRGRAVGLRAGRAVREGSSPSGPIFREGRATRLFVHGGVLPGQVDFGLSTRSTTGVEQWLLGKRAGAAEGSRSSEDGPVWSRVYSDPGHEDCARLAQVESRLGLARMVVGHTVQKDGVTSACGQHVWRIDVGHVTRVRRAHPGARDHRRPRPHPPRGRSVRRRRHLSPPPVRRYFLQLTGRFARVGSRGGDRGRTGRRAVPSGGCPGERAELGLEGVTQELVLDAPPSRAARPRRRPREAMKSLVTRRQHDRCRR